MDLTRSQGGARSDWASRVPEFVDRLAAQTAAYLVFELGKVAVDGLEIE